MNPTVEALDLTPNEVRTLDRARRILAKRLQARGDVLNSPQLIREFLRVTLAAEQREIFLVIFLDVQNRMIAAEPLFAGTLTQTSVYPREVVKAALAHNASSVALCHNHPSGVAEPSQADRMLTDILVRSLDLIDVRVLDHFVVAGDTVLSFSERGLI